jgi:hypothetical protein
MDKYTLSYKKFLVQELAHNQLRSRIQESVQREFLLAYCKSEDPYEMLVALRYRLAQTDKQKERKLATR